MEDYKKEKYKDWATIHGVNFTHKLENETAFDGIIKIYSIKTDSNEINKLIKGIYFGKMIVPTTNGVLLRLFKNKNSWPKTRLVFLNMKHFELMTIKESHSSYENWTIRENANGEYTIQISPDETIDFVDITSQS